MKRLLSLFVAVILLSFTTNEQKEYTLKFSEGELSKHFQNLSVIKQIVDKSSMPHNEVKFIIASIDSLQKDIQNKIKDQIKK